MSKRKWYFLEELCDGVWEVCCLDSQRWRMAFERDCRKLQSPDARYRIRGAMCTESIGPDGEVTGVLED